MLRPTARNSILTALKNLPEKMHQRLRLEQIWELDGHSRPIFDPQICTRGLISTSFRSSRIEGRDRAGALRALQPRPYFEQPRPTARNSILRALKNLPEKMHQRPHLEQIWELGGHRPIFDPQICIRSPISGSFGSSRLEGHDWAGIGCFRRSWPRRAQLEGNRKSSKMPFYFRRSAIPGSRSVAKLRSFRRFYAGALEIVEKSAKSSRTRERRREGDERRFARREAALGAKPIKGATGAKGLTLL